MKLKKEFAELKSSVKTLELDNADLTQKLMHVDKNLRQKFQKEFESKTDTMTDAWKKQKDDELKLLKDDLEAKHAAELDARSSEASEFKTDLIKYRETCTELETHLIHVKAEKEELITDKIALEETLAQTKAVFSHISFNWAD